MRRTRAAWGLRLARLRPARGACPARCAEPAGRQVSGSAATGQVVPQASEAEKADDEHGCADDGVEQEIHSQGPFAGVLVGI